MHSIAKNIDALNARIANAARSARREPGSVTVVAASKTRSAQEIQAAYAAGLTNFGENYTQEAIPKVRALEHLPLTWHYIGAIQSNKTKPIAEHFHWVHTVDRTKIARRLNDHCPADKTLHVCLQVNVDADPGKAGVAIDEAPEVLGEIASLPSLCLRGLMTILSIDADPLVSYARLRDLFLNLTGKFEGRWDTLSMGMSRDFEQAITCGATHVRIGTDVFGARG